MIALGQGIKFRHFPLTRSKVSNLL